jgi:hypothetical protein
MLNRAPALHRVMSLLHSQILFAASSVVAKNLSIRQDASSDADLNT